MSRQIEIIILIIFLMIGCQPGSSEKSVELSGKFLGQKLTGDSAEVFAPGIISTGKYERDITMTPDGSEIYWGVVLGNYDATVIMVSKEINGVWSEPEVASFSQDMRYSNVEPHVSPDGKKLFFASDRPDSVNRRFEKNTDIWVIDRTDNGWGKPYNIGEPVNSELPEFFPSTTLDGTLYLTRDIERESYIYRSELVDGKYTEPVKCSPEINSTNAQFNAFIAPDESYIIVPSFGRLDSRGRTDYYISYNLGNDKWSELINLGDNINTPSGLEYSPYVSPDGKYFFFMSAKFNQDLNMPADAESVNRMFNSFENGNPDIYWIQADFIHTLKP